MTLKEDILKNISCIKAGIEEACVKSGRDSSKVLVVAVSKKQSIDKMNLYAEYCRSEGLPAIFGESYVQEFRDKRSLLIKPYVSHLIGALQSNKARDAVSFFDLIESTHSEKIAQALNKEAEKAKKKQDIFLQVNISEDPAKHGFRLDELSGFLEIFKNFESLRLKGLMTITRDYENAEEARADYKRLRQFRDKLYPNLLLSMGMSHDYKIAIEEGADIIRIGTALFGNRA